MPLRRHSLYTCGPQTSSLGNVSISSRYDNISELFCCVATVLSHTLLLIIINTADKLFQQGSGLYLIWIASVHFDSCFYSELLR